MKNIVRTVAAAALVLAGTTAGVGAASATTMSGTPCHLSVASGKAYWKGCSTSGDKVRVSTMGNPDHSICVELNSVRFLGYVGGDWGMVTNAVRTGACPS